METLHLDQGVQSRPVDSRDTSIDPGGPPEPIKDYPTTFIEVWQDTPFDCIQMCGDVQGLQAGGRDLLYAVLNRVVVDVIGPGDRRFPPPSPERTSADT